MRFKRRRREATPPFVSMADIAFNLVLFFLIMAKSQNIEWEAAAAEGNKPIPESRVAVTVDKDGKLYLDARQVSVDELSEKLPEILDSDPNGSRVVLLKIHKETQAATFQRIIEAVSKVGGEVVHVLEEETK